MHNFIKYDKDNPTIWAGFLKYSIEAKLKGFNNYSAKGIFEIMRWHTKIRGKGEFKIQNNFTPDYARKLMKYHPEFKGFFRIRKLKAPRL